MKADKQSDKALTQCQLVTPGLKSDKQSQSQALTRFEQADTFFLKVELGEDTLKIQLRDYEQWKQYSRTYTREDIGEGKQINRRIDLYDIYCSLIPNTEDDQGYVETKQIKRKLRIYKFGTIIQNNTAQFSIHSGGNIKVWVKVMYKRNNKIVEETVLSNLVLNQVGTYNDNDIFKVRYEMQNRFFKEKYQYELDNLKGDHSGIYQKFSKLQYQISQLREENQTLKQMKTQTQRQLKNLQNWKKQNQINKQINTVEIQAIVNERVEQKYGVIKQQMAQEMNNKIRDAVNNLTSKMDQKYNELNQSLKPVQPQKVQQIKTEVKQQLPPPS